MPPVTDVFMLDCLKSLGVYDQNNGGALSPTTILDWSRLTGYSLSFWQGETLLVASMAYASAFSTKTTIAPWGGGQKTSSASIRAAFRAARGA